MVRELAPLYSYMRRYRWGYVRGILASISTNIIAVQFPCVLGFAEPKDKDQGVFTKEPSLMERNSLPCTGRSH